MAGKSKLDGAAKRRVPAGRLLLTGRGRRKWRAQWAHHGRRDTAGATFNAEGMSRCEYEQGWSAGTAGRAELSRLPGAARGPRDARLYDAAVDR